MKRHNMFHEQIFRWCHPSFWSSHFPFGIQDPSLRRAGPLEAQAFWPEASLQATWWHDGIAYGSQRRPGFPKRMFLFFSQRLVATCNWSNMVRLPLLGGWQKCQWTMESMILWTKIGSWKQRQKTNACDDHILFEGQFEFHWFFDVPFDREDDE